MEQVGTHAQFVMTINRFSEKENVNAQEDEEAPYSQRSSLFRLQTRRRKRTWSSQSSEGGLR